MRKEYMSMELEVFLFKSEDAIKTSGFYYPENDGNEDDKTPDVVW